MTKGRSTGPVGMILNLILVIQLTLTGRSWGWSTLEDHIRRYGTTVLFSTRYLEEADQHAERIVLMGAGRVTADGTPAQ